MMYNRIKLFTLDNVCPISENDIYKIISGDIIKSEREYFKIFIKLNEEKIFM